MRMISCALLGMIAAFFVFMGTALPIMLRSQAADNRAYYENFKAAGERIDQNGQLPNLDTQLKMARGDEPLILSSLTKPSDCDPSFKQAPADRFVLSFWRGEWRECYAHPSGRTSLPMSVQAYLRSGLGTDVVIYWLIALAAAWGAILLRPGRKLGPDVLLGS